MPTPMEKAPEPALDYAPIPSSRYTDKAFAEREWERMWTRVWLMAGRESDIPRPGDYFSFEIGNESLLIIRQADGGIRCCHNVCMHRGNRLCEPGRGNVQRFWCGFHGWQYNIDGSLRAALDAERFPQGIPCDALALRTARCDTWAGFVFVSLNPDVEPLHDYLGVVPAHLDPYGFENWKIAFDCTIEIDCNWKTCVDAFNEAYHIAATHTWTLEFSDDVNTQYDCYDKHTRMIFPELVPSPRHSGHGTVTPKIKELFLERLGADTSVLGSDPSSARALYAKTVTAMGPMLGADFSRLNESQMCDDFHYTLFPNVTFNTHSLFVWVFTHRPHPEDPNRMYFDFINLVNAPAQEIPRPEKLLFSTARGDRLAGVCEGGDLLDEDLYNLPRIQQGMRSSAFESLHLGEQEVRILHFHKTLMDYLGPD